MDYASSRPFHGSAEHAFDLATSVLASNGFQFVNRDASVIEFEGPGMRSTKQNPLLGASWVRITARHGRFDLEADLGGVRQMRRFLHWFPFSLAVFFFVLFGLVMGAVFGQLFGVGFGVPFAPGAQWVLHATWLCLLPLSPWLFLSPILSRQIRAKCEQSLESLLASITVTSHAA